MDGKGEGVGGGRHSHFKVAGIEAATSREGGGVENKLSHVLQRVMHHSTNRRVGK